MTGVRSAGVDEKSRCGICGYVSGQVEPVWQIAGGADNVLEIRLALVNDTDDAIIRTDERHTGHAGCIERRSESGEDSTHQKGVRAQQQFAKASFHRVQVDIRRCERKFKRIGEGAPVNRRRTVLDQVSRGHSPSLLVSIGRADQYAFSERLNEIDPKLE